MELYAFGLHIKIMLLTHKSSIYTLQNFLNISLAGMIILLDGFSDIDLCD